MGKHKRALGHGRAEQSLQSRHCHLSRWEWPEWLEGETPEIIDEVMEYLADDDDDDGHEPAKVS